ncbi:MAG: HEPN domain-containing protein [bacterium]|nr:HEPN domain-containing protein [bacterium]MCS7309385.1 HEPN domain-containing protein [Armatimonadota bacterium]
MSEEVSELVREWVRKAENDWKIALHDMQSDDPTPDMVCYHMQQCVEKYLKAYLVLHQIPFRRTHDIAELLEQCIGIDAEFATLYDWNADTLSAYGVEVRYPSFTPSPSLTEAQQCVQIAGQVRAFVRAKLAQSGLVE